MKAPPTEKPPPPPLTPETVKKDVWPQQKILSLDDDIDEQEKEIIASLEQEEREHKKYKERVQAMRSKFNHFLISIDSNVLECVKVSNIFLFCDIGQCKNCKHWLHQCLTVKDD